MPDPKRIDALAREVQAGRHEAFDEIVRETVALLRSQVRFLIEDDDLADDVVQETYVQLFQEIDRYTPGTNFLAWARTLARTQALSARFRRGRERAASNRYNHAVRDRVTAGLDSEEPAERLKTQMERLQECLGKLQEKARSLVELRYFQRLSLEDVAARIGVKTGAAGVSLHRIRATLHKCMTDGEAGT